MSGTAQSAATPRLVPRLWWLLMVSCSAVALYALAYVLLGDRMYPPPLVDSFRSRPWGIYPHAFFGMLALGIAPFQFRRTTLVRRPGLHRRLGQVYLVSALLTGTVGLYMSMYSYGGIVTHLGFAGLAVGLLVTATMAWRRVLQRRLREHREWVIRSFAFLFSAVTLRVWLPLLMESLGGFEPAYALVSWLCWVPNILVAEWYLHRSRSRDQLRFLTLRRTAGG